MATEDLFPLTYYLDVAWRNIGSASLDLDLPDVIGYADITARWPEFRQNILTKYANEDYLPLSVEKVDLPKDRISVRPLARLDLEHRLVYEALVSAIAPEIGRLTSRAVYSSRWWTRKQRMLSPVSSWINMQKAAKRFHLAHKNYYLARADISSFFEHVDVDIMADDLRQLNAERWAVGALERFLRSFSTLSSAWGIPQGPEMSGILANLYLMPLDSELRRSGFTHFRYSDDMYIFGKDWTALRQVLVAANKTLRHRHLNLAASKTEIIDSASILQHLEDRVKDSISYGVNVGMEGVEGDLHDLFDTATDPDEPNARDLKFCLTNLAEMKDDYAVDWVLDNILKIPHVAREALLYLSSFTEKRPGSMGVVVNFLRDEQMSIYPYAQSHVLIFMMRNNVKGQHAADAAWRILLDRNAEGFLREMAARYLGLTARPGESARLKQEYQVEPDRRVRRALLVACYESKQCSDEWLQHVARSDPSLSVTAEYLRSGPVFIPYPSVERPEWR